MRESYTLRFFGLRKIHLQFIVLEEVESLSVDTSKDLEYVRKLLQREKDIVETGNKKAGKERNLYRFCVC